MHAALEAVQAGDHIVAIYPDKEKKLEEAFQFLKAGLDANEAVVLITDDLPKDKVRSRMCKQWQFDNVSQLEARGDITIATTREWYFPDGKLMKTNTYAACLRSSLQRCASATASIKWKSIMCWQTRRTITIF